MIEDGRAGGIRVMGSNRVEDVGVASGGAMWDVRKGERARAELAQLRHKVLVPRDQDVAARRAHEAEMEIFIGGDELVHVRSGVRPAVRIKVPFELP